MKNEDCDTVEICSPHQFEPFGGLIPDTIKGRVLAEIVADPFSEYTPKIMAELTDGHRRYAQKALKELEEVGLIKLKGMKGRQPIYRICESKKIIALTFLSLAIKDDELHEECMDQAVCDYVKSMGFNVIREFQAGFMTMDYRGRTNGYALVSNSTMTDSTWRSVDE